MTQRARWRAGLAGVVGLIAVLAGCQDSDPEPEAAQKASLIDGRYCGLVSTEVVHSLLGREVETSDERLRNTAGPGVVGCTISASPGRGYVRVVVDPVLESDPPPESGECEPASVPGWSSVTTCWNTRYASVLASPPEEGRFIRIDVQLDEPGAGLGPPSDELRTQSTDAAVRIAQDVNTNFDRL